MGTVILHAGMPKAGSSSIQSWLAAESADLAAHDIALVVATDRHRSQVEVVPFEGGGLVSGAFLYGYLGFDRHEPTLRRFIDGISAAAQDHATTVITAEGFANLFTPPDEAFLAGLERLAGEHEVRVAYYVRPQDTSLEAAWCQWGFRLDEQPSAYLGRWAETLGYRSTLEHVRAAAPSVSFEVRPFRTDLLIGGDVVADFAEHFLGLAGRSLPARANRGLPLDVVNILRAAPPGLLWDTADDNRRLDQLRSTLTGLRLDPTPEAIRSRQLLRAHCHERFEPDNARLIAELAWDTACFVPAPDPPVAGPTGLDAFDSLWAGASPETVREILFAVLSALVTPSPR